MTSNMPNTIAALLDVQAIAAMLGVSDRHVYRLCDSGRMPGPVKLGGANRWRRDEIAKWIADGCPRVSRGAK